MALTRLTRVLNPAGPAFAGQGAYDLVSLAAVKAELQLTTPDKDQNLRTWITQASGEAARFCNRVFPVELLLDQVYPDRDYFPQVSIGGVDPLQLKRYPVAGNPCTAGIAAPSAPVLSSAAGGALAAQRYYVVITYVTAMGETAVSAESNLAVAAGNLLQVTSPVADPTALATGWNVYVGTTTGQELPQNATPIAIGTNWTLPASGLIPAAAAVGALPSYVSVIENNIPLIEGADFLVDYTNAELTRLDVDGWPKRWPAFPIQVQYQAGYAQTNSEFADLADAVTRLVKGRYYAQTRDPALRQENIQGVYSATWWFAAGPGAAVGNLPPDVQAILEKYRSPVIG